MVKEETEGKEWPATLNEAVGVVLACLPDTEKTRLAGLMQEELITLHFGLGMWIRNNFGLWQGNTALRNSLALGHPGIHPDDASMVIIEAVWRRLREMAPKVH